MTQSSLDQLSPMTEEKRIGADDDSIGPLSNGHRNDIAEIALGGGAQDIELECKRGCGLLHLLDLHSGIRVVWVYQQTHRSDFGHDIAQHSSRFAPTATDKFRTDVEGFVALEEKQPPRLG